MKALPWLIAAAGIGAAIYAIANAPSTKLAGTEDGVEKAANTSSAWGTKQRVGGTGGKLTGNLKEGAGKLTGDKALEGKGLVDQAAGVVQDTAGKAAHAVSDSLHDLSKA